MKPSATRVLRNEHEAIHKKIEREKMGAGTNERMHLLIDRLCAKNFSVARATA